MEAINDFIYFNTKVNPAISETICIATQDVDSVYLQFDLAENDCLLDFKGNANQIFIRVAKAYFEKYAEPYDVLIEKQKICCNTQSKLFELVQCELEGLTRKIFCESIILYLLFQVQKNNLVFHLSCDSCSFVNKPTELDKIVKAREFILNNLSENITIPIVASYVGTNQCYLKKGFKEVMGQTIFEFIQENRMVKAKHLLIHTQKRIQDVAAITGYASMSSFSQTYKAYYGIAPSLEIKKSIPES